MGELAQTRAQFREAETSYQRALLLCQQTLGEDHPTTIRCLGDVAGIADAQGRYEHADTLYQQALATLTRAFGPDHPAVATVLIALAELFGPLRSSGRRRRSPLGVP